MNVFAAVLALLALSPFLWLLVMSFKTNAEIFRWPPRLLFPATLDNYAALWTTEFRGSFANSLIVSVASTLVSLVVGVPAAYALSRWTGGASGTITLWILASRMAPPIAFTIPYFLAYRYLELLDTLEGLIIIYLTFNLSLVIWMMRPFYDQLPRSLEEAAWIDGATLWQAFLYVALPLARPGIVVSAILSFITSWNNFIFGAVFAGRTTRTMPVAVYNMLTFESFAWGPLAAAAIVVMLPVILLTIVIQKEIVQGLASGGVK